MMSSAPTLSDLLQRLSLLCDDLGMRLEGLQHAVGDNGVNDALTFELQQLDFGTQLARELGAVLAELAGADCVRRIGAYPGLEALLERIRLEQVASALADKVAHDPALTQQAGEIDFF